MVFSDALPVQIWLEDCDTYNDSASYGVHPICWFQPWLCDDEINIQFIDEEIGLGTESISLPALSTWATRSTSASLPDWTTGATPSVDIEHFETSEILHVDYAFIAGRSYTVTINYTNAVSIVGSFSLKILNSSFTTIFSESSTFTGTGAKSITIEFTATSSCTKVGVSATSTLFGNSDTTVTVTSTSGTISVGSEYSVRLIDEDRNTLESITPTSYELPANGFAYFASFSPLDYDICDQKIKLEIWRESSPEVRVGKSDYIDVRESQPDTKLISYSNNTNFSGLIYDDVSPAHTYYIRVNCRFFHERFPQTDEAMELTSSVITTSSQKKKQKLLEVIHAPYYIHNKLIEVLQHHTVIIDNRYWKKEEGYDVNEGEKRWPLKTATTYLTDKTSLVRNVT